MTETVQKSVRLSRSVYERIERYRGWSFTEKLHNYIRDADTMSVQVERLRFENEQLRLQIKRLKSECG